MAHAAPAESRPGDRAASGSLVKSRVSQTGRSQSKSLASSDPSNPSRILIARAVDAERGSDGRTWSASASKSSTSKTLRRKGKCRDCGAEITIFWNAHEQRYEVRSGDTERPHSCHRRAFERREADCPKCGARVQSLVDSAAGERHYYRIDDPHVLHSCVPTRRMTIVRGGTVAPFSRPPSSRPILSRPFTSAPNTSSPLTGSTGVPYSSKPSISRGSFGCNCGGAGCYACEH